METTTRDVWKNDYIGRSLLLFFALWWLYWTFYPTTTGKAGTLLAVVAAVMTFRGEMRPREKLTWLVILLAFLRVELRAIDTDHSDFLKQWNSARTEDREGFGKTAQGIADELKQTQADFNASLQRFERIEQRERDLENLDKQLIKVHTPSLKQEALQLARNITEFLRRRDTEFAENADPYPPERIRQQFEIETAKEYQHNFMPEAVKITHEFVQLRMGWSFRPYRFVCGLPDANNVGNIDMCSTQLRFTAEHMVK